MKKQYHIKKAADVDQEQVERIFKNAAARFNLADIMLASLVQGTICNYSEGLGFGFGLGALRIGDLICVDFNPAKSTADRYNPVFDYIAGELTQAFGDRVVLAEKDNVINAASLPRIEVTDEHRAFAQKCIERIGSRRK